MGRRGSHVANELVSARVAKPSALRLRLVVARITKGGSFLESRNRPHRGSVHEVKRPLGILLHEWTEQWIVKRLEGLKTLDGFRRSDQSSDSGSLAGNTVAICAVADQQGVAGCRTGCGHERLETSGMRFEQPDIAGRDDMMNRQAHRGELRRRGVIRRDTDLLAGA